jgi:hypothetical protein
VVVLGFDRSRSVSSRLQQTRRNLTGTSIITTELAPKRLSLLYDLDPGIQNVAVLLNPGSTGGPEASIINAVRVPAGRLRCSKQDREGAEAAFASAAQQGVRPC